MPSLFEGLVTEAVKLCYPDHQVLLTFGLNCLAKVMYRWMSSRE